MGRGDAVLCYVDGAWAWFTTQPLDKQWGDDWNDAPYEHNAGRPYDHRPELGGEPWELHMVAWDADLVTPADSYSNSPYSVQDINAGEVPWLRPFDDMDEPQVTIPAGVTLTEFRRLIRKAGGMVYEPSEVE